MGNAIDHIPDLVVTLPTETCEPNWRKLPVQIGAYAIGIRTGFDGSVNYRTQERQTPKNSSNWPRKVRIAVHADGPQMTRWEEQASGGSSPTVDISKLPIE